MPPVQESVRWWVTDMFHAEANKGGVGLLTMSFAQHVDAAQMGRCLARVRELLDGVKPGFQLVTDLSSLELMDAECVPDLRAMMNLCNEKGVKSVLRVIPHPEKDIGFTLLSHFHYGPEVEVQTYETLADAMQGYSA